MTRRRASLIGSRRGLRSFRGNAKSERLDVARQDLDPLRRVPLGVVAAGRRAVHHGLDLACAQGLDAAARGVDRAARSSRRRRSAAAEPSIVPTRAWRSSRRPGPGRSRRSRAWPSRRP